MARPAWVEACRIWNDLETWIELKMSCGDDEVVVLVKESEMTNSYARVCWFLEVHELVIASSFGLDHLCFSMVSESWSRSEKSRYMRNS